MSFTDSLFGRPLATSEERAEHVGVAAGIPIFGLDALTSAAYGPETALSLLIPLGMAGIAHLLPIVTVVLILLGIVFFSYRQTIAAYPSGGGSYTVASENLGTGAGLVAAAALMIDYILTAAVGIVAGITAVVSDQPWLQPHMMAAVYSGAGVPGDGEHARREGYRRGLHRADVSVCGYGADHGWGRLFSRAGGARTSDSASGDAAPAAGYDGGAERVAGAQVVLQRLCGDDRRRGGLERGDGVPGAAGEERADGADGDHGHAGDHAVWHGVAGQDVRHHGDGSRTRLPEPAELDRDGGVRAGLVLPLTMGHLSGADAERQYGVCGFSAGDARDCAERLSAARVHAARAAAAVLARHVCADGVDGGHPVPVRRQYRQLHLAVRHWRVPGVHAVAGGDGGALEEAGGRTQGALLAHVRERDRRGCDGHHDADCAGCQVHLGRMV